MAKVINSGYKIIYEPEVSVYHWYGIHQDNNEERLRNVVRIVEEMSLINDQKPNTQSVTRSWQSYHSEEKTKRLTVFLLKKLFKTL